MKCWICGNEADSGEHLIKASDLKSLFGHVTQNSPLFFHTDLKRNQPIAGIKSDKFKYQALLCARCNNERTQPHDRAWERLSAYLRERQPPIRPGMLVRLDRAFPGGVSKRMLEVHLFFLKLFGCLITENSIPIRIEQFAQSILRGVPHPNVWLALWTGLQNPSVKHAGCSPVETVQLAGRVAYASWFYVVDQVAVNVMYSEPGEHRKGLIHAWHPSSVGKRVRIVGQ
ncbi:MAG: hypothetical protein HZA64_05155 [Rhodocyclales bacterium]|nr:hypothetical protein [Rhodocyclales bacterium]